ncbi:uncharacterized protein LOC132044233 [Lycium ferocissimum]|uniref:uncharacterized protein LOC132044233 n=1 Tax=Lycium ferocissimum TaxID=112874 RepID=UPI00281677E8|nr:uncharacterized protein LOC132044233 [Lycium ferocissimum]
MKDAIRLLTQMLATQAGQQSRSYEYPDRAASARARDFLTLSPPEFKGTDPNADPQEFIDGMQRTLDIMRASATESVELASYRLQGIAINWFQSWKLSRGRDAPPPTWQKFSDAFLRHHMPPEPRRARVDRFLHLQQGSMSVREYSVEFNSLARYAPSRCADMEDRIHHYVRGLEPELREACMALAMRPYRPKKVVETESKSSKKRYQPHWQTKRSNFRMDRGSSGHNHHLARSDRRNDHSSGNQGLQFRNDIGGSSNSGESLNLSEYNFMLRVSFQLLLRDEVVQLLMNGHLREFLSDWAKGNYKNKEANKQVEHAKPQHVINMIISGVEIPRGPMMKRKKVSITQEKKTRDYILEGSISFNDEDAEGIIQPQNDALVISVLINKSQVKRILINPGSSANVIHWKVVEQLGLLDQIVLAARVLNGFNMSCELQKGKSLCRSWVHDVTPNVEDPNPEGVKMVHGEQPAARKMFAVEEAAPIPKALPSKAVEEPIKGRKAK